MSTRPRICQIAMCTADAPTTARLFTEVFGFADAAGRLIWGEALADIQALPGGASVACSVHWLVGRQEFVQLELFTHTRPRQRPLNSDWRASDLGWVRWGLVVPDFDLAIARLEANGVETLTEPMESSGLRRVCFREPGAQVVIEVLEEGTALAGGVRPPHFDLVPAVHYVAISVPDLTRARQFCGHVGVG